MKTKKVVESGLILKKDNKYYSDYFEKYGEDYKQIGESEEVAKGDYIAQSLIKTMNDLAIDFNEYDIEMEGDDEFVTFTFDNEKAQNEAFKKLYNTIGNEREIRNYKDGLAIRVDDVNEYQEKVNTKKDAYVKNAINSGKYKGSPKEIANQIFQDSPYSIHSAGQIQELVLKYLGEK